MRDKTKHPADMALITLRNYWYAYPGLAVPNIWFPIDTTGYAPKRGTEERVWDSRPRE